MAAMRNFNPRLCFFSIRSLSQLVLRGFFESLALDLTCFFKSLFERLIKNRCKMIVVGSILFESLFMLLPSLFERLFPLPLSLLEKLLVQYPKLFGIFIL